MLSICLTAMAALLMSAPAEAQKTELPPEQIERVALIPIFKGTLTSSVDASLECPICNLTVGMEDMEPDADSVLTNLVQHALERKYGQRVVPPSKVLGAFMEVPKDETKDTPLTLARKTGRALEATHVMVGLVWRFRERVGGSMGVESPASVGFVLHLVDVEAGQVVWRGAFQETQRSLSENILDAPTFFKRGGKWLTAAELADSGVEKVFQKLPF